jgi:hypothetical protein
VVIGDWNCDGLGTPALLRPATGEVFVFSTWGSRDQPVEISRTAQFVGAIRLVPDAPTPRPDPDDARPSCRQLRVELFGGNRVEVNP